MSHNITVEGGKTVRLTTAGKYCDQDIIITAEGGKEDLDAVLTEQDGLIDELREVLKSKGGGGGNLNTDVCNVRIVRSGGHTFYIGREIVYGDGTVGFSVMSQLSSGDLEVSARCDSVVYVMGPIKEASCTSGEVLRFQANAGLAFKTPATAGADVTVTIT